ncbi:MAG: ROK family protein [Xenococcaceae cyanobacterium MO_188.B32]|nr:ROK family protein [Xenococcaceae cyanobacterium MO_188.B32]
MKEAEVIGIDLGGTAIKLGRFLKDGTCLESLSVPTPQPSLPEAVVQAIALNVNKLKENNNCIAIGIGSPGPADSTGRIAKIAINLIGWDNVPLADRLEAKTELPTIVANDANCAGIGEAWLGAGRKFKHLIVLTLGTGVGGAIILDGKLFTGHFGAAGELGLTILDPKGHPCRSGNRGSLEQHASIGAIYRATGKEPAELGKLAQLGDRSALEFWQSYGQILGAAIASLIYVLTPEAVIIGGGISASAEYFLPATITEIEKRVLPTSRLGLQVLTAELGNKAGMLGAAKLAWELIK